MSLYRTTSTVRRTMAFATHAVGSGCVKEKRTSESVRVNRPGYLNADPEFVVYSSANELSL